MTKKREQEIHMHKNASGKENEDKNSQDYFRNNSQRLLPKIQNAFAAILRSYNDRIAQHIQATIFVFYLHTYIFGER